MKIWLIAATLLTPPVFSGEDLKKAALTYMATMEQANWDAQRTWYTEDSVFEDPTSDLWGESWRLKGPGAITNFFKTSYETSGTTGLEYRYQKVFAVKNRVILEFDAIIRNNGSFLQSKEPVTVELHVVTILLFKDGKVIHHLDHADYADFNQRLAALKAEREKQ